MILPRRTEEVSADTQTLRVKFADRPDGSITGKVEADDLVHIEGGRVERTRLRRKAEQSSTSRSVDDD